MKLDLTGIDYTDISGLCLMNVSGGVWIILTVKKELKTLGQLGLGLRS